MNDKKEFEPYGDKWRAELMKWTKADLIEFARAQCLRVQVYENNLTPDEQKHD